MRGQQIAAGLPLKPVAEAQLESAETARQQAVDQITRTLNTDGIRDLLLGNLEHPRWNDVAERCLSCTNCTMVCPTCFCSSVTEVSDLQGEHVERQRQWDSCFNFDFSYMNGGIVRNSHPLPLSPVADAQAGLVDRPVRRLRAASAAGGASPGVRSAST